MNILLTLVGIIGIIAVIGAITGGSTGEKNHETRKAEDKTGNFGGTVNNSSQPQLTEREMKLIRLEQLREGRLIGVRQLNAKCIAEDGVPYRDEKAAMEEFDDQHFKDYQALGVLPPSYRDGSRKRKALYRI